MGGSNGLVSDNQIDDATVSANFSWFKSSESTLKFGAQIKNLGFLYTNSFNDSLQFEINTKPKEFATYAKLKYSASEKLILENFLKKVSNLVKYCKNNIFITFDYGYNSIEFKKTISGLLENVDDDEWIFWASDDTYLMEINEDKANKTHSFVESLDDISKIGVTFGYIRAVPMNSDSNQFIEYDDLKFIKRTYLTNQWAHQYWRAWVLKYMFDCIEEAPKYQAKAMDGMLSSDNKFLTACFTAAASVFLKTSPSNLFPKTKSKSL